MGARTAVIVGVVLLVATAAHAAITGKEMIERAERIARDNSIEGFTPHIREFEVDGQLERVEVWYKDKHGNVHYKAVVDAGGNVTGPAITTLGRVYKFVRAHTPPTGKSTLMVFDSDLHGTPFINYVRVVDDDQHRRLTVWFDENGEPYKGDAWDEDGRHTWGINNPGGAFVNKDPGEALQPVPAVRIATQPCEPCRTVTEQRNEVARAMNDLRAEINDAARRHAVLHGQAQLPLRQRYDVLLQQWTEKSSELQSLEAARQECEKRCRPETTVAAASPGGLSKNAKIGIAAGVAVVGVGAVASGGSTSAAQGPTPQPSNAPGPGSSTPPAAPGPSAFGFYGVNLVCIDNPRDHHQFVRADQVSQLEVTGVATMMSAGAATVTFSGPAPWVGVGGEWDPATGRFSATGRGRVAGNPNIRCDFNGTLTPSGELEGDYVMGVGGGLPGGGTVTYHVSGRKR